MRKTSDSWKKYSKELEKYLAFDNIVFLQNDEDYAEAEAILEARGIDALFNHLKQWEEDRYNDVWDMAKHHGDFSFGSNDTLYFKDKYCININFRYGYVGLYRCIDEEEYKQNCECF
jgi:hypothetical protein